MAFDFIKCGFGYDDAISYVMEHAQHLGDFPSKEIESAFGSAYKTYARRGNGADS